LNGGSGWWRFGSSSGKDNLGGFGWVNFKIARMGPGYLMVNFLLEGVGIGRGYKKVTVISIFKVMVMVEEGCECG